MVDKQLQSREMRRSKKIWVRLEIGQERVFIGGTYLVPEASSRCRKAEHLVEEIGKDVARYAREGEVVAGDWNCKIGRLASLVRGREFERENISRRTDRRG